RPSQRQIYEEPRVSTRLGRVPSPDRQTVCPCSRKFLPAQRTVICAPLRSLGWCEYLLSPSIAACQRARHGKDRLGTFGDFCRNNAVFVDHVPDRRGEHSVIARDFPVSLKDDRKSQPVLEHFRPVCFG